MGQPREDEVEEIKIRTLLVTGVHNAAGPGAIDLYVKSFSNSDPSAIEHFPEVAQLEQNRKTWGTDKLKVLYSMSVQCQLLKGFRVPGFQKPRLRWKHRDYSGVLLIEHMPW